MSEDMSMENEKTTKKVNVLMVGTGEYTTGYVGGGASHSDKGAGVVALTMFDLRRRGKVNRIGMCGVNGTKFPGIRAHLNERIGSVYRDMDLSCLETFPADDAVDANAYRTAIATSFQKGDVAIVFTPDDTHFDIAMACVERGMHVMVTKPIVQTLSHHLRLSEAVKERGDVLMAVEVHKRFDPFYADARDRARASLGDFQYMYSYMSQPKLQLDTFKAWAGKSSDISYYLNSHHIDWSEWTLAHKARPVRVTATASTGVAHSKNMSTEDSITLTVQWCNFSKTKNSDDGANGGDGSSSSAAPAVGGTPAVGGSLGCAVYTSSWVAPPSDVHSQQRFFYMGSRGEINVDQAHRGCTVATDETGFASINPLFMKYTPTNGQFAGQASYGVKSFETFIDACIAINQGMVTPNHYDDGSLATVHTTLQGTAILEAGRTSLDRGGQPMDILYEAETSTEPTAIVPHVFHDMNTTDAGGKKRRLSH